MRKPIFVGLACVVALAGTATAAHAVRISGGSPPQQRVVRVVLAKLRSPRITAVTFTPHAHLPRITNGQKMDIAGVDRAVRTYWDENLFVAAYLRESVTRHTQEPSLIVMNGDSFIPVHGPRHPGRIPPPGPRASAKAIARYVSSLRAAATTAKAQIVGVDVMRPGPIGVALTLKVADPASFLRHRVAAVLAAFNAQPTGILARYLGVQGRNGKLVFEVGYFPGSSRSYIARALQGCNPVPGPMPIPLPRATGKISPPCPAK
jgi:hypothetical protein